MSECIYNFILVLSGPAHPNIFGLFLAQCSICYVSTDFFLHHTKKTYFLSHHFTGKYSYNLIALELETVYTIKFTWVYPQVCSYKYLLRYNDVKSIIKKNIITKQGEYHDLTQVVPFIQPYRKKSHHCRKLLA